MPHLTGSWTPHDGAVITVLIGVGKAERTRLRKAASPIPQPKTFTALIDTGAEVSCIDPAVVPGLGLASKGFTLANWPAGGGLSATVEHSAAVRIPHPPGDPRADFVAPDHSLTELPIGALGYEMLIGRDLLVFCAFRLDGPALAFTLDY